VELGKTMEGMRIHASEIIPTLAAVCLKDDSSNSQTNGDGDKNNKVCPRKESYVTIGGRSGRSWRNVDREY
jgi:hypothetical protein